MKRKIYVIAVTLILTQSIFGQNSNQSQNTEQSQSNKQTQSNKIKFGISPSLSLPTGLLSQVSSVGLGIEMTGVIDISPKAQAFGQLGYQSFIGKNFGFGFDLFDFGGLGDIGDLVDFVDFGGFGINTKFPNVSNFNFIVGARTNVNNLLLGSGIGFSSFSVAGISQTGFTFSPQIGYATKKIDIIGHWTNSFVTLGSLGFVGVKTYYRF
jgi:hypothetical protein